MFRTIFFSFGADEGAVAFAANDVRITQKREGEKS
jgi:hypothetical protein